jgi:putative hemolysin
MDLLLGFLFVIGQAFFAGTETAFIAANRIRVVNWASDGRKLANTTLRLLDAKEEIIIITLIGTNICVVLASFLFTHHFVAALGPNATGIAIAIVTVLSLVFGEFLPKAVGQAAPEEIALRTAPIFVFLNQPFRPFRRLFRLQSLTTTRERPHLALTRQDFLVALNAAEKAGHIPERLAGIVANLLSFSETKIREIMKPLSQVTGVPKGISKKALAQVIEEHRYSRYPVYQHSADNIVGTIHTKDLLLSTRMRLRRPYFVAADDPALAILKSMKEQGEHFALVLDKKKQVLGLVTLEDLLEELIGEIRSEE